MSAPARLLGTLLAALAALPLSGCLWYSGQAWPGPMEISGGELPPGDSDQHLPGPEEVSVLRHSDPVRVRPAGALTGFPLSYFEKRARLSAGGSLVVAPGGRAEVIWPSGSSVVIFGRSIGWVGSPSRGEPIFSFQEIDSARLELVSGDRVELLGGSVLSGDSGPYMIDRLGSEVMRVRNQSDGPVSVAFRDEVFDLAPGQNIRLPLLSAGGRPVSADLAFERFVGPGFTVLARGPLALEATDGGVTARGLSDPPGERKLRALGVVVRLDANSSVRFRSLGKGAVAPAAAAQAPASEPAASEDPPAPTEQP